MNRIIAILFVFSFIITLDAQDASFSVTTDKDHQIEFGLHAGHFFSNGNVDFTPGFAGGIHIRKALDYVFSLRLDLQYGQASGEDPGNIRSFENTWMSGSIQAIATLNNLKWDMGERKTNFYLLGGIGLNSFEADLTQGEETITTEGEIAAHLDLGAGIAFRVSEKINIGIEHKATFVMGDRGDLIDGVQTFAIAPNNRSTFFDGLQYTSVRINFNLGKLDSKTEPLYWLNPLDAVVNDVQLLKDTRVTLNDSDEDGVIDQLDEEEETPRGALVNSKGLAIDSDKDGIADHEDSEPHSPIGYEINDEGVAQQPDIMKQVEELLEDRLKSYQPNTEKTTVPEVASWFIPSIYFENNSYQIGATYYGTLYNIGEMLNANSSIKLVVTGHADPNASDGYNNVLSYNRAKSVIDYLVSRGVEASRLILHWKGESENLIEGVSSVNRRVDFKVADGETNMESPK